MMKVSICIPTYNQAQYLEQAIKSSCNQSLQPFEIIVSNDCSTDNTRELLEKLSLQVPILKVLNQNVNLGIARNTDACLRLAKGDFIVRLDSDDYLAPEYVEKLSKCLIAYPQAGYAHAAVQEIDQSGTYLRQRRLVRKSGMQTSSDALKSASKGYRVAANIIMFRRAALTTVNYITGRPDYVEDYHLSATLAAAGYANVYLDQILSFYRVWVDAGKIRQKRKLMEVVGLYRVFSEVLEPAYKKRNWSLAYLNRKRTNIASKQADCLAWDVYTTAEKQELLLALAKLSSSPRARFYRWIYLNGHGGSIKILSKLTYYPLQIAKALLLRFRA